MRAAFALSVAIFGALLAAAPAEAGELSVMIGPPEAGSGGSNPVSVPPVNPTEYQIEYATEHAFEWSVSLVPGAFFGRRSRLPNGVYVGMGGGVVIDTNGVGPGIYTSLGYSTHGPMKFECELKQALGYDFGKKVVLAPYAIRIGTGFNF